MLNFLFAVDLPGLRYRNTSPDFDLGKTGFDPPEIETLFNKVHSKDVKEDDFDVEEELRRLQQEAETTSTALSKIDEAGKKFENYELSWARADENKASWISYTIKGVSILNEEDWPRMAKFHAELSAKMADAMIPFLTELSKAVALSPEKAEKRCRGCSSPVVIPVGTAEWTAALGMTHWWLCRHSRRTPVWRLRGCLMMKQRKLFISSAKRRRQLARARRRPN